jgi:WD40 repeat protein
MTLSLVAPATPFKGLSPFDESELDALFFFGREREREVVVANLMASRLTVLFGPSGVGKTSLLRAGVAHALRSVPDADVVVFSAWPVDPLHGLRAAIADTARVEDAGEPLHELLAAASAAIGGDLYVILDQFEEYFLYHDPDEDGALADELAEAIRRPGLRANFLLGIREDALAKLDAFKGRVPGLFSNSLRLDRLDRAAGEAAIVGPINAYNALVEPDDRFEIEPALVTRLLDEVTAGRVDLGAAGQGRAAEDGAAGRIEAPYLQLVLERLWDAEARGGSGRLRLETLEELHGASRIVHEHLDRAMAGLSPREQDAAAAMYNHLVTPSGSKIAHGVADLAGYAALDESEAAAVLRRLSAERIVRAGENGGSNRYEIYHDVLADAVVAWRTRYAAERRLKEQRVEADRRQRRLVRILAGAFAALAVVAAIAVYALVQRSEARHQTSLARFERTRAEHQKDIAAAKAREALAQKHSAVRNAGIAKRQRARAQRQRLRAERLAREARSQERLATAAKLDAESAQAEAEGRRREALRLAAEADRARADALSKTELARQQTKAARRANALATRRAKVLRARQLEAEAKTILEEDPRRSLRLALAALRADGTAGLKPDRAFEAVLRQAVATTNLRAILPNGGGPVRTGTFSPDGSLVLVAGKGGARVFDSRNRFGVRRLLPATDLNAATFSPDGHLVAAAAADGTVPVWDATTGLPLFTLRHDAAVDTVAFSPDGRFLATGSADGIASLWTVAGGLHIASFSHPSGARRGVRSVSFSPDSQRLLTVGGDRFARVFDVTAKRQVFPLNNVVLVNSAKFSNDGKRIATAGADGLVRIWDARTGQFEFPLRGGGQTVDLAFSADDSQLAAAGGADTIARVWDLQDGAVTATFTAHRSGIESVSFSPDAQLVLSTGRDGNAYAWKSNGGFIQEAFLGHRAPVTAGSFSRDGTRVVTASDDGSARVWTMPAEARAHQVADHGAPVNAVAFGAGGRVIASAGDDKTARLIRSEGTTRILQHDGAVTEAAFSRDGKSLITGSADGNGRIWRVSDGTLLATLQHGAALAAARLSPNGRIALTAGRDGEARLWDAATGTLLHGLRQTGPLRDARFSPDGKLVVTAGADGAAAIWRVSDGRRLASLVGHTDAILAAAFSPDGRFVATASTDTTARIWNARTGALVHVLAGHSDDVIALAFSPDGATLATSSLDRDARAWNVKSGRQVALLRLHIGLVSDVAFSADGRWLATAGPTAAGIWETRRTGLWPATPPSLVRGFTRPINDVAFSPRGWRLLMGSRDGSVRVYDCTFCGGITQLAAMGRARLGQIVVAKP